MAELRQKGPLVTGTKGVTSCQLITLQLYTKTERNTSPTALLRGLSIPPQLRRESDSDPLLS
jgi:hypothetical protein